MLPTILWAILLSITQVLAISYRGADISSLPVLEAQGQKYSDAGTTKPFETILASHGANLIRIRIWASDSSDYSLSRGIALAKRGKAAGMAVMVDFHYSDTCRYSAFFERLILLMLLLSGRG